MHKNKSWARIKILSLRSGNQRIKWLLFIAAIANGWHIRLKTVLTVRNVAVQRTARAIGYTVIKQLSSTTTCTGC